MSEMTVCVLGGTGFVGRHLIPRLTAAGYNVKLLTRNRERHRELLVLPTVSLVQTNVHDEASLRREFAGCAAIINLTGILNETRGRGHSFADVHVELPRKIGEACRAAGVARLVHISALKADPNNGPSDYLKSRGAGEAVLRQQAGADLRLTILQPSVIFGPGDSFANRFAGLLRLPLPFMPLPRARARFAPIYVGDVSTAIVRVLADRATWGASFQLCGPEVFSLRELVQLTANLIGKKRRLVAMPDALARIQARIMDFVPGKPFSTDNYKSLTINSICDQNGCEKLGITPASCRVVMPMYLSDQSESGRLSEYRRHASTSFTGRR